MLGYRLRKRSPQRQADIETRVASGIDAGTIAKARGQRSSVEDAIRLARTNDVRLTISTLSTGPSENDDAIHLARFHLASSDTTLPKLSIIRNPAVFGHG